ncbi:hypothetical protein V7146_16250 [Gottfriedia acidiceleris]|uniref:hypothetical protein n=1 Tax=Gottfriedia acidiceleris TaxID=371036 RepID=UPI002FFF7E3F
MYSEEYKSLLDMIYERMKTGGVNKTSQQALNWDKEHPGEKYSNPYRNSLSIEFEDFPNVKVNYPGYKTNIASNKLDFQVSFENIPISHVNIIVDFYNKVVQFPELYSTLENFINDIGKHGNKIEKKKYSIIDKMEIVPPKYDLTMKITKLHKDIGNERKKDGRKTIIYNYKGNYDINYTLDDELIFAITLILLQEDVNYPKKEGRRMPLKRYLEGIYLAVQEHFNLKVLIDRTQFDGIIKPEDLSFVKINYDQINELDVDWTMDSL